MKIKTITVSNLKAVTAMTADFNGCTAIVTGANNKGKTSFLRGLFDRVRGNKPDQALKEGEKEGFAEAVLTSNEKIRWEFKDGGKEKLLYFTDKDIKAPLTVELRRKFLPDVFDVDKFLTDPPAKQRKTLQDLAGLDFSDIDTRYKTAYDDRENKNRRHNEWKIRLQGTTVVPEATPVDIAMIQANKSDERTRLNELYLKNKQANTTLRNKWQAKVDKIKEDNRLACNTERERVSNYNSNAIQSRINYNAAFDGLAILESLGYKGDAEDFVSGLALDIQKQIEYIEPKMLPFDPEPTYIDEMPDDTKLKSIDAQIIAAIETNNNAARYKAYVELKKQVEQYGTDAVDADTVVKSVEKERMDLIKSAKMPEGFSFSEDGILYNGLSFTREQLSSSGIYIAALKLGEMQLGEIRTLHFDASFLDKNSLAEIEKWANAQDLQLLIERPDWDGGEIKYELIQN